MSTITKADILNKLSEELRQDLGILYAMGVKNLQEPEAEKARNLAASITAVRHLTALIPKSGISCHVVDFPDDGDVVSGVVAAFYARVRQPTWLQHPEAVWNTAKAKKTAEGRVLASAAQTLTQTLVASGFTGSFEGSPSEVADVIRNYLKGN